ncbi:MAG: FAD-linked oxidase C-terminal domain-containing protein, partial [Phycisphaeraceae bacterium]|nr:FAD-linked oxidase C-terminal domain-containing protein [Phycisphaeraceae bacterium]
LVGTEGTCATILETTVRLVPSPAFRTLVVLGYPDLGQAGDDVSHHLQFSPIGLEGMDRFLVENMRAKGVEADGIDLLPDGEAWLFVEFGGDTQDQADAGANRLIDALSHRDPAPPMEVLPDREQAQKIWRAREAGLGASARLTDGADTEEGWEDSAVPVERLGDYLRDFQALVRKHDYRCTYYGHFGQGLVHCRIDFDLRSAEGIKRYRAFVEEGADLVHRYGGSISGEHGDGQSRGELLPRMYPRPLIDAFGRFKALFDPDNRMNPGKVYHPDGADGPIYGLDDNLKHGADFRLPELDTAFNWPEDDGNFGRAVTRCIGVGKCRRDSDGTMCPSWRATHDEKHTTRGRARLLWDMASGELPDGWRNQDVREALDLCLACKGCKSDCPASVDIATYKAEFLSHHYENRLRPRSAYAFGLIHTWARIGRRFPRLTNFLNNAPGFRTLTRWATGMAHEREAPAFARQTFKRWFANRRPAAGPTDRPTVVLWADTFNDHFHPDVARAAVTVLESAGYDVEVPMAPICCGRPLYDFGMLDRARSHLEQTLAHLKPHLNAGHPIVGLEPSCVSVFRDELPNLMADDPDAIRLSERAMTLAEFLVHEAEDYQPPELDRPVLFHGHCHQKTVLTTEPDLELLRATGAHVSAPDTGCCGMAGSFGFKADHYRMSVEIGEKVLLPAVRDASEDTLIVTDGFSCQEQIHQLTNRRTIHLAQLLAGDI